MAEVLSTDITTKVLNGTGVFDDLMNGVTTHLDEQYSKGRITGTTYSTVYLGALEAVLAQAVSFVLQRQQADVQARLGEQQILNAQAEHDQILAQTALVNKQIEKLDKDILLVIQETANAVTQGDILEKTVDKVLAETSLLNQNVANGVLQGKVLVQEELQIKENINKTKEEVKALVQATKNAVISATNLLRQQDKLAAETNLINQKKATEVAQIADKVDNVTVTGVLGKQKALYQAQTDGFFRDAEQKLAKIMADSWAVRRGTDEGENPAGTGLTNVEIKKVLDKARAGIAAT